MNELHRLLVAFNGFDAEEVGHRNAMLGLLAEHAAPFDKNQFEPGHFTASGYVVSPDDRAVLLIFHDSLQRWLQPGGHFDTGDLTALDAARRELSEEVGLHDLRLHPACPGLFDVDVHRIPARNPHPEHLHFDVRFLFRARSRVFKAGSDALRAEWIQIPTLEQRTDWASVHRVAAKLRKLAPPG